MSGPFVGELTEAVRDQARWEQFVADHEFPLVEGRSVTFVFRGEADEVNLRHFIFGLPSSQPLERVPGTDLWVLTMEIPRRSRVEYKLERVAGDSRAWILDPLNPNLARDPYGANSVCHGEGYRVPTWAQHDAESRPGTVDELALRCAAFGDERPIRVYLPARFRRNRRYPLLVVHDGSDYLRYSSLQIIFDNLIHRLEISPMIVALTDSPDRLNEYGANDLHAQWIADELVPAMESRFPLIGEPAARALMGASFGGVACLHTAWKRPGAFGRLLLQSGSFAFSDIGPHGRGPAFDPVAKFVNSFRNEPGRPSEKVFISCGTYESLIYENRSIVPLLQATGMDVRYVEARDGHNWENWRDRLRVGLSWLNPGPLWMVYE